MNTDKTKPNRNMAFLLGMGAAFLALGIVIGAAFKKRERMIVNESGRLVTVDESELVDQLVHTR
jgi:hypothetical protein